MAQAPTGLGSRVRLRPLQPSALPAHPDLASLQASANVPDLTAFVQDVIAEAEAFMTGYLPSKSSVKGESKSSPPSTAGVKLLACDVPSKELPQDARTADEGAIAETWFARTSVHANKVENGTASWAEFETGLLDDHSQHEMDYTPDVYDANRVLSWDDSIGPISGWEKVGLGIYEMAHKIPPPLNNRVFSVVIVTARSTGNPQKFLVVQVPVDISKVPKALYSNGRHKRDGNDATKKKDVTMGVYVSIERCELIDDGANVQWKMGTASDAKGVLPMWAQKMAVPGTVVKDVGLFIDWTQKQRKGQ